MEDEGTRCKTTGIAGRTRGQGIRDQKTAGPKRQTNRRTWTKDHQTRGPQDQSTTETEDERTRGPEDHGTRGPKTTMPLKWQSIPSKRQTINSKEQNAESKERQHTRKKILKGDVD